MFFFSLFSSCNFSTCTTFACAIYGIFKRSSELPDQIKADYIHHSPSFFRPILEWNRTLILRGKDNPAGQLHMITALSKSCALVFNALTRFFISTAIVTRLIAKHYIPWSHRLT